VSRLLDRANKKVGVSGAATLLMVVMLLGQLLGFFRYKIINANFPALGPDSTDAFFAAFKIPDFFFYTLAAGALGVAFMPVLSERLEKGDKRGVWALSNSLMNLLAIIMAVVGVVIFVFAEPLIHYVVAPNLPPVQLENAVNIMRIIAFNPLLFAMVGVLTSTQQTMGRFFFFAIGPLFYNTAIIISVFIFRNSLGIVGLGVGALIGAILQLGIAAMGLLGANYHWSPKILWRSNDFKTILRRLPARSIDQGMDSINSIAETNFATRLGVGNVTYYENAFILHTAPILLIGTAISTAAFPKLTERLAQNRYDLFRKEFLQILRAMIWIAMPTIVVCFFARAYFARLIFSAAAPEISLVFGFFVGAILFRIIFAIISRWFYAQKDTVTPLIVSLFIIALNLGLAFHLSKPGVYGIAGLAMAQSVVAAIEVVILFAIMVYRDRKLFDAKFWGGVVKILSVTGFSSLAAYSGVQLFPLLATDRGIFTLGSKLGLITVATLAVHVLVSLVFELEEAKPVVAKAKKFILKPIKISY